MLKYIDVSQWQDVIDWETVKPNIDGAILRAGYGKGHIDKYFERNAAECNRLGIPIGAYWFSYAKDVDEAKAEAEYFLSAVRPYRMELPLAYDFEYDSVNNAAKQGVTISKSLATMMARGFCETVEAGGYWTLFYANPDYLKRYFDESLPDRFGLWLAEWGVSKPDYSYAIWQKNPKGRVPGISGDVDMNEAKTDFKTLIANLGLNHLNDPVSDPVSEVDSDMEWARKMGLLSEAASSEPVTWGDLFHVLRQLYRGESK